MEKQSGRGQPAKLWDNTVAHMLKGRGKEWSEAILMAQNRKE